MHNSTRLVKGRERCTALLNPSDAETRGINDGAMVRVSSAVGAVELPAEVSDEIVAGVVSIPHGWGHTRSGTQLGTANAHPGISINDLTDSSRTDPLCGTAAFSGEPVSVEPL